jgi:hypothetical protein
MVKVSFTLPEETYSLLKRSVPKRRRSAFVAEKIEEELHRRKLLEEIRKSRGAVKDKGPKAWGTEASTRAWIRAGRENDRRELEKLWNK